MADKNLGSTESLNIEGVGRLQWTPLEFRGTPETSDDAELYRSQPGSFTAPGFFTSEPCVYYPTFKTPNNQGFSLRLMLDEGYRDDDLERYSRSRLLPNSETVVEHWTANCNSPRFPGWLIKFADDLMDWTEAKEVWLLEEDTYPGEESTYIDISLDYEPHNRYGFNQGVPIKNHAVFLGTAAVHLARLLDSSE